MAAPDNDVPPPDDLAVAVEIFVGGKSAAILLKGRSPYPGIDQITFQVPDDAPPGCWVPMQVRTGGTVVSNTATLAISADGSPCSDPFNPIAQPYLAGNAAGLVILETTDLLLDQMVDSPSESVADFAHARILKPSSDPFFFNSLISLPPIGSCATFAFAGDIANGASFPGVNLGGKLLDAGSSLTVSGVAVPRASSLPIYDGVVGSSDKPVSANPLAFRPSGSAAVSAAGGADVGAFQASVPSSAGIRWTNRDSLKTIDRTQGLRVTWDPPSASGSTVILTGGNVDTAHNASSVFMCTAAASDGALTVPPAILANVPSTSRFETRPKGSLVLMAAPLAGGERFNASGISAGVALYLARFAKSVSWE
jgi:hypothetical protein